MAKIRIVAKTLISKSNRIVQHLGADKVIKFGCPKNSRSGGQNRTEGMTWQRVGADPLAQQHLARVYAYAPDGSWLIQEKIEGDRPNTKRVVCYSMQGELIDALDLLGIDTTDMWAANWRERDGKAVAIDYGYDDLIYDSDDSNKCGTCIHCTMGVPS